MKSLISKAKASAEVEYHTQASSLKIKVHSLNEQIERLNTRLDENQERRNQLLSQRGFFVPFDWLIASIGLLFLKGKFRKRETVLYNKQNELDRMHELVEAKGRAFEHELEVAYALGKQLHELTKPRFNHEKSGGGVWDVIQDS